MTSLFLTACQDDVERLEGLCEEMGEAAEAQAGDCEALVPAVEPYMAEYQALQAEIEAGYERTPKDEISDEDRARYERFLRALRPCHRAQLALARCGAY